MEKNRQAWNLAVEASHYAVLHHKYEALTFGGNKILPLIFEKGDSRLLFPFIIEDLYSFKQATVPVYDYASVLPNGPEAIALIPEAIDHAIDFLKDVRVDLLTIGVPFFLPEAYVRLLSKVLQKENASKQEIFVHAISTQERPFEEIWMNEFSKHARNRARKAEKEGVSVREIEAFENWISDMHLCNMSSFYRQKRYPRYPHSEKDAFLGYLNRHKQILQDNYGIYGAFYDNHLIAYMATVRFSKSIVIGLMMSMSAFLSRCPNDALLKHLVQYTCDNSFSWIFYSFDRVSQSSQKPSLLSPLVKFKFDHGFREYPMKIYSLGLTRAGRVLQKLASFYNYMFVNSAGFPTLLTSPLQRVYERQKYRPSQYTYAKDDGRQGVSNSK